MKVKSKGNLETQALHQSEGGGVGIGKRLVFVGENDLPRPVLVFLGDPLYRPDQTL